MRRFRRDYGLSIVLAALFLSSWLGQLLTQWPEYVSTQTDHGFPVEVGDFLWEFGARTLENWQSEFLQLLTFVVLTAHLVHRGSAESKDSDDEILARLERIEGKLEKGEA